METERGIKNLRKPFLMIFYEEKNKNKFENFPKNLKIF